MEKYQKLFYQESQKMMADAYTGYAECVLEAILEINKKCNLLFGYSTFAMLNKCGVKTNTLNFLYKSHYFGSKGNKKGGIYINWYKNPKYPTRTIYKLREDIQKYEEEIHGEK